VETLPSNAGGDPPAGQVPTDVPRRSPLRRALLWTGAIAAVFLAVGAAVAWSWTRELPAFDGLKDYRPLVATRVLADDGSEAFVFARERRTVVPLDEIPVVLRKAVVAAEDARFYEHQGVNYLAILKCAARGVLRGRLSCGGSTITQQVVKTFLLQSDWKPKRKVKELVLAPRLEQNLKKDEILYLYLNQIYFGHGRYGVEEASRFFFAKPVKDLTLGEAAMLAGVIQSPARWSPVRHPVGAKERQRYVLRRMAEEGFITAAQAEAEERRPIVTSPPEANPPGAWYADAIRRWLDEKFGAEAVDTEGFQVEVAMDPRLQRYAESALEADLRAVDKRQGWRGPVEHLDEARSGAAVPAWRERLQAAERPGEVMVWDLSRVDAGDIEPTEENESAVARMAIPRPLEAGEIYGGLVVEVREKEAVVDLGNATGLLPLADVAWARKFNPTAATAAPRQLSAVVARGDVILVRVMPGRTAVTQAARAGRPLSLSLEQTPLVQGAFVVIDPVTRGVRALVGGYDFATSQFNRALQARRQPGSAFKPFVWGAAIESRRFTPATVVYDTPDLYRDPWTGKEWKPKNFERDAFDGPMLLQAALAHSKNTVSVKLLDALGVDRVADFARRMGIAGELPRNLTMALGTGEVTPIELVNAYASVASGGRHGTPRFVLRVCDRTGAVLYDERTAGPLEAALPPAEPTAPAEPPSPAPPPAGSPPAPAAPAPVPTEAAIAPPAEGDGAGTAAEPWVVPADGTRPDVAYVLTAMMREVIASGTGVAAKALARPAAAKTGTAQDHRDAWFVGFTPELVAGVWVGMDDHGPLGARETGAGAALPAWLSFMQAAVGGLPPADFLAPPGVEQVPIDPASGLRAEGALADTPVLTFLAGTAPTETRRPGAAPSSFFIDER
jgi:penicillin-binding protein 1A